MDLAEAERWVACLRADLPIIAAELNAGVDENTVGIVACDKADMMINLLRQMRFYAQQGDTEQLLQAALSTTG